MTKRYSILRKKLQEVESQLNEALSLPPESTFRDLYSKDIEQRLDFLKTLLCVEVSSSPQNSHHLQHIGKRLTQIETAFRDRRTTYDPEDNVSNCSCTDSCLNEEVGFDGYERLSGEKERGELRPEEKGVWGYGTMALATAGGVVIGMGLMGFLVLTVFECFPYAHHLASISFTPT